MRGPSLPTFSAGAPEGWPHFSLGSLVTCSLQDMSKEVGRGGVPVQQGCHSFLQAQKGPGPLSAPSR